jgi:hypothetical protein
MDLFRFTASGQRDFTGGSDGQPTYFSTDGTNVYTGLQYHAPTALGSNDGFDWADWDQTGDDLNAHDPFGPGGPGAGSSGTLSATDLRIMDVLGWTLAGTNRPPVLTTPSGTTVTAAGTVHASSLFAATDADNDALTYWFYDRTSDSSSGHFEVAGVAKPAQTWFSVSAAQLTQTTFVPGSVGHDDDVSAFANDGKTWSNEQTVHIHVNDPPVLTTPSGTSVSSTGAVKASTLFAATDADHDILSYWLYDRTSDSSSGHFEVGGVAKPAQTWFSVSATQLAQTTFVPGTAGHYDDVSAFANDGAAWSNERTVRIDAPSHALVSEGPYGASTASSNDLAATDISSDLRIEHSPGHEWSYFGLLL